MKQRNKPVIAALTRLAGMGVAAAGQVIPSVVYEVEAITPDCLQLPRLDQLTDLPTGEPDESLLEAMLALPTNEAVAEPIIIADAPPPDEVDEAVNEPIVEVEATWADDAEGDPSTVAEPIAAGELIEVRPGEKLVQTDREGLGPALEATLAIIYDLGAPIAVQAVVDAIVIRVRKRRENRRLLEALLAQPTEQEHEAEETYRDRLGRAILEHTAHMRVEEQDGELVLTIALPANAAARAELLAAATR